MISKALWRLLVGCQPSTFGNHSALGSLLLDGTGSEVERSPAGRSGLLGRRSILGRGWIANKEGPGPVGEL